MIQIKHAASCLEQQSCKYQLTATDKLIHINRKVRLIRYFAPSRPEDVKMTDAMPRIIQHLIRDHRNMSMVLDVLNEELERYRRTGSLDFEVLIRLVDYIRNYPDLRHHPREDLLFKHLKEKTHPDVRAVEQILEEHEELANLTRRLSAAIHNLWQNVAMPRPQFEALIESYIQAYRRHMRQEEEIYFPALRKHLQPADWHAIEAEATPPGADPLFDGKIDAEYQTLHGRIMSLAR